LGNRKSKGTSNLKEFALNGSFGNFNKDQPTLNNWDLESVVKGASKVLKIPHQ